ncbi:MAG: 30S ribosomal protein S20 [Parcubacteria group bacterium CG11_big_fil_rev_8_21_14_0_20_39_22]|nr:MAG: 30S ribosomal protein S20 [Parcubacteria group bacterium CG11_big_fil_rev_8_21_14_0_20_39_22]
MAITSSAKKAHRASLKKKKYNDSRKENVKTTVKQIKKLITEGKNDEAKKLLPTAYKAIDKAAKGNTIRKGNADRKKSRLSAFIKKEVTKKV